MKPETKITITLSAAQAAALQQIAGRSSKKLGTTIDPDVVAGVLLGQALEQAAETRVTDDKNPMKLDQH